ncbi:hypothetical protein DPMN_031253 [Dreissena polymorpha]|uniref:Uncharacterized protein n=1 Tax=Dreissena polymorpha TaxID=45954 RepID=A0A9D4M1V2_DREPO|nr:hypothetical protein DPMN_031253 [Dreissena polymorpha]
MFKILVTSFLVSNVYCNPGDCDNDDYCIDYCAEWKPNTVSSSCNDGRCFCDPGYITEMTTSTTTLASSSQNTKVTSTAAPQTSTRSPMCGYFNATRLPCKDNSACGLPNVLRVLCPDPAEVIYCPQKCGCC